MPNQGSYPVLNALEDREPVKDHQHVAGNVTILGNLPNEANCRAQNSVQACLLLHYSLFERRLVKKLKIRS